jgi:uncharacterized cupin superfamily protein
VPGMGIPLHKHPFAEFFYVLEGTLAIGSWNSQGAAEWDVYGSGESLVVQPNAPHAFFNKSEHPCRMLSVSTYHHERMMKDAVQPDGGADFLPAQLSQADFEKLTKSMEKNQTFLVANHA